MKKLLALALTVGAIGLHAMQTKPQSFQISTLKSRKHSGGAYIIVTLPTDSQTCKDYIWNNPDETLTINGKALTFKEQFIGDPSYRDHNDRVKAYNDVISQTSQSYMDSVCPSD